MFSLWVNIYLCFVYFHIIYVMYISVFNVGRSLKCHWIAVVTGRHCLQHFLSTFSHLFGFYRRRSQMTLMSRVLIEGRKLFHVTTRKTQPWFTHVFCIIREQWKRLSVHFSAVVSHPYFCQLCSLSVSLSLPSVSVSCLVSSTDFFLFFSHHTFDIAKVLWIPALCQPIRGEGIKGGSRPQEPPRASVE